MSIPINLVAVIIAVVAIWPPPLAAAIPAPGLDAFLSDQLRRDPSAANDSFLLLPSSLKSSLAANPPPPGHRALISAVLSLQISVPVYVKLVGASFSSSAPHQLLSFASAALSSDGFTSISSLPSHALALSHSLHLEPSLSTLAPHLSAAIASHISSSPAPLHRSALSPVPFFAVDDIVAEDFRQQSASSPPGFFIYILNLGPQGRSYAYSTDDSSGDSPAFTKCMGSVWAGKERYIWIDLAAGPVDYGPSQSGEGLLPQSELHPLSALHSRPKSEKSLLADLASLVLSAYRNLLVPSLRIPAYIESSLLVQLIHIRGSNKQDSYGLDWGLIENTIRDGNLVFGDQHLVFKRYSAKLMDCPICSFAVAKSMNSYTSRFLFENFTMIVSEYLDSKRLHKILSDSAEDVRREVGVPEEEEFGKVLPVYVFDLDYDRNLLLDRFHQAVAFRNMVIAVRTLASQSVSDYSCNGRHVIIQTRNLERPIVGSVLQSMWGVSPTHMSWSPKHNSTLVDYTWSVGQTPFGPFSETLSLSFAQKDAAQRNVLITSLNATVTSAIDVLESLGSHGGDRKVLKKGRHVQFVQRWNLFKYKLDKVVSAMSHLDYEKALYFLRSSDHDLFAIHNLVYSATQELEASLVCFKDPPFPWVSISISAIFLSAFFYIYAKRDKIFRSKRKQF